MSDEQKGRSAGAYWVLLLVALLPGAVRPERRPGGDDLRAGRAGVDKERIVGFYVPVIWLHNNTPLQKPIELWAGLWGVK